MTNSRATYGYRRVWAMVNRTFRVCYNRKRIRRVMQRVAGGADGTVQVVAAPGAAPQAIALRDVTQINPPPVKWTWSITANALVSRGKIPRLRTSGCA